MPGACAGYGEWGCIFDPFRRRKPEAYLTKQAFSPIHVEHTEVFGDETHLTVQDPFDQTLRIRKGCCYPSIAWGNDPGRKNPDQSV